MRRHGTRYSTPGSNEWMLRRGFHGRDSSRMNGDRFDFDVGHGKALTPTDLVELEKMLVDAGVGDAEAIEHAREASAGFGRFVRSLFGLDRQAVNGAFAEFLGTGTATREQTEFVGLVIDHLTA